MTHTRATEVSDGERSSFAEKAHQLKEKGNELGRKTMDAIESGRGAIADRMESAAQGLHRRVDSIAERGEKLTGMAHHAADRIDSAAHYVRDRKTSEMLADLEALVRAHPGKALLATLAVGYLAGRALKRG